MPWLAHVPPRRRGLLLGAHFCSQFPIYLSFAFSLPFPQGPWCFGVWCVVLLPGVSLKEWHLQIQPWGVSPAFLPNALPCKFVLLAPVVGKGA